MDCEAGGGEVGETDPGERWWGPVQQRKQRSALWTLDFIVNAVGSY